MKFSLRMMAASALLGVLLTYGSVAVHAQDSEETPVYPREVNLPAGKVLIHHPSVVDWRDYDVLSAWVPLEVSPAGSSETWLGSVLVEADTDVDFDQRLVKLSNLKLAEAKADGGQSAAALALQKSPANKQLVLDALSGSRTHIGLEFLIRALPEDFLDANAQPVSVGLNPDPPRILLTNRQMQLMLIDGPPVTSAIEGTRLEYVVNTNWPVFHDLDSDTWYTISGDTWLKNTMLSGGDWIYASELPGDFQLLAMRNGMEGLQDILPPRPPESDPLPISISFDPAELVIIDGKPEYKSIPDTNIQYVSNSEQDIFVEDGRNYLLLSGRWFWATNLNGVWNAAGELPADFLNIPPDSDKGYVLSSIPGTEEARVALIEASIPHKRLVLAGAGDGLEVQYAGAPEFVPIDGTPLRRASNTPYQVIQHNNFYYLVDDGVWYRSEQPQGPWSVATQLPSAIYDIPPTDPAYNVTFVRLDTFNDRSGEVAYSYTNGYRGTYSNGSAVVFGTGWAYPGAIHYRSGYPAYGYFPPSYGHGAWYRPAYGRYGYRGFYDPYWGYPRSTTITIDENQGDKDWVWNMDGSIRTVYTQADPNTIGSGTYQLNGAKPSDSHLEYGATVNANTGADDVFADENGTLFRRADGEWQTQTNGQWVAVTQAIPKSVQRQLKARRQGYGNYDQYRTQQAASATAGY